MHSLAFIPDIFSDFRVVSVMLLILAGILTFVLFRVRKLNLQLRQLRKEKEVMHGFISDIGEAFTDTEQTEVVDPLRQVLFYALNSSRGLAGIIYLQEPDGRLRARAISGIFPPLFAIDPASAAEASVSAAFLENLLFNKHLDPGETLVGEVAVTGKHAIIEHATEDPRLPQHGTELLTIDSLVVVPMRFRNSVMGVMAVVNPSDGVAFNQGDLSLLQVLADQASVSTYYASLKDSLLEKERIDRDLELATNIQQAMLPGELPDFERVHFSAINQSAKQVGGDYYDVVQVDETHIGIAIADVSGKGIVGALVMAVCRSILRVHAAGNLSPAAVLQQVQASIQTDLPDDMFITMSYIVLNLETLELKFVRAGHEPLLHFQADTGKVVEIEPPGVALGLLDEETFGEIMEEETITLKNGDFAGLYTDGVTEAMNAAGDEWGKKPLIEVMEAGTYANVGEMVDEVHQQVLRFTGDMPQSDDITFVIIGAQ